jgi:cytochrome bd-type quinol oxidase subunit 1
MRAMRPVVRRDGPLALALVACLLLIVAEFTTLYQVRIITVVKDVSTVGAHHGYALLVLAVAAAAMAYAATRGRSRPAALALLAIAVVALVIVAAVDLPVVDEEGTYGRDYEQARAQAATGFYLETAGAALLLFSAVTVLVLPPPA